MTATLPKPFQAASLTSGPDVAPGTMPAWAIVFSVEEASGLEHRLTVGSDSYDGSVSATLPFELGGGHYEAVIEGLTDEDYQRIRLTTGTRLAAALHLWWRDTPAGVLGDLALAAGLGDLLGGGAASPPAGSLVAVIRVDTLRRQAGERRYDTLVSGRERVVARLGETAIRGGLCYASLEAAARGIARDAGIDVVGHGLDSLKPPPKAQSFADVRPGSALQAMRTVRDQAAAALGKQRPSAAVIRDGVLHVGLWTERSAGIAPLPVVHLLDAPSGLVSAERGADADIVEAATGPRPPPARAKVTATALGRPDIKPGDLLQIPLPPEDFPVLASSGPGLPLLRDLTSLRGPEVEAADPTACLVTQVTHRLSRRQGFVTTIQATVLRQDDDGWDPVDESSGENPRTGQEQRGSRPADHAAGAAGAVEGVVRAVAQRTSAVRLRAGQVRAHTGNPADQNTSDVWYSTAAPDGMPAEIRRVPITPDQHAELPAVPVVTPFAFGGYGLVLPRYPGSRVLLADAGGGREVVDLGGVWEAGVSPPAQPGDWWLLLPLSRPTDDLTSDDDASPPTSDVASHDLIDSDGRRLIEVAGLTLRVIDTPTRCDTRPDPGDVGAVVIENTKNGTTARLEIKDDGSITITGSSISIDAGDGDITMKAANVKVKVSGTMDVSV
jgi:hypothetical protein